jgi:LPXTG-motif cell wall-anchored protein
MRRTLISTGTVVTAVTAASLLLAPAASASGNPKGDNGTVKIHDSKTGEELRKNEPKVCTFYIDAFGFDAGQKVDWHIEAWANNDQDKGTTVKSGLITLDADGHERTEDMTLPNGQYKLFWNWEGENGRAKHKVFKTKCKPGENPSATPSVTPSVTPSTSVSGTPGASETPGASATPSATDSAAAGATPSASTSTDAAAGSGDLAETGSSAPVGILAAAAVALAGAGAFLVTRRRKAQQH